MPSSPFHPSSSFSSSSSSSSTSKSVQLVSTDATADLFKLLLHFQQSIIGETAKEMKGTDREWNGKNDLRRRVEEEKRKGTRSKSREKVDPMLLLPMLKEVSADWRRSFDSNSSTAALNNYFWRREDRPPPPPSSSHIPPPPPPPPSADTPTPSPMVFGLPSRRTDNVAALISRKERDNYAQNGQNRPLPLGQLQCEHRNHQVPRGAGVASALNSPIRIPSPAPVRARRGMRHLEADGGATSSFSSAGFFHGEQMQSLIRTSGGWSEGAGDRVTGESEMRAQSASAIRGEFTTNKIFRGRPHTLQREFVADQTTVCDALGYSRSATT